MDADAKVSVILPPEEFAEDLEQRLGRANGNVYHRREGVDQVHDGQIMVRLKKKRYIVIDYGIVPSEADRQLAAVTSHISCPEGAGKQQCVTPECAKVGVPVLLYDSAPEETASLYLRSGLCFTCQRMLNEKRRTNRKRKDETPGGAYAYSSPAPSAKKMKVPPGAIIIPQPPPASGIKHHADGFGYSEIGEDLQAAVREAADSTNHLVAAAAGGDGSTTAVAVAAAVAAAEGASETAVTEAAVNAAVDATGILESGGETTMSPQDVSVAYEKAYASMSKGIFLLTQWKASWDAAIASAVAQETADAVASAAAVVAAGQDQNANMIPLLLAAEERKEAKEDKESEVIGV